MQASIAGEFGQVNRKLDGVVDEIHEEGAQTRAEIIQDVQREGELTRETIRQTMTGSGKLIDCPSFQTPHTNVMYQKYRVSDTHPTPDLTPTWVERVV